MVCGLPPQNVLSHFFWDFSGQTPNFRRPCQTLVKLMLHGSVVSNPGVLHVLAMSDKVDL